ncbi:ABC transporter ATP-binding protein [Lachnospiraceae bacterium ZAX-1]
MAELLRMEGISKRFGDMYANKDVSLTIQEGEVHTLLGENGAGKSTLMNILIGLYQPTKGQIFLRGKPVKMESPKMAVEMGIGMVHQHFMLVEVMTVFENIILGTSKDKSPFIKKEQLKKEIMDLSAKYDLQVELDKEIAAISVGAQQRVEILKALYRGADILILDEPTAALTDPEVDGLFKIIQKLLSEHKSVVFISHKMKEVLHISTRITILRAGEAVKTLTMADTNEKELVNLMIGHEMVDSSYKKVDRTNAEDVLTLENVSYNKQFKHNGLNNVSLKVKKGEILGIAGVDGNGQSQLAMIATGVLKPHEGHVLVDSKSIAQFSPNGFISARVSHIPEDRNKMGLVGSMTVSENLVMKDTKDIRFSKAKGWYLNKKAINAFALDMQKKNDIRCSSVDQQSRNLSGGNQQKVILARELSASPELLVAVHPTRGLDIGATQFVHNTMVEARDNGCGILLISANFDEVLEMSDRIIVMFEGEIMGVFSGEHPLVEQISLAMTGKRQVPDERGVLT